MAADYGIDNKKAAAATAVAVKRILDRGGCRIFAATRRASITATAVTPFGEMGVSREQLIADKYLLPDKGYETGLCMLHYMGLTTQMPKERLLATNAARDCVRHDRNLDISICPPRTPVSAENKAYLQTLDALVLLEKAPVDAKNPYAILAGHIRRNGLQYETLLYFADRFYSQKTIIRIAHTAGQKEEAFEPS